MPKYKAIVPEVATSLEFYLLIVFSVLFAFLLPILRPIAASIIILLASLPFLYLGLVQPFNNTGLPMEYSLLVLLMLFGMNVLLTYFSETQKKQKLINLFSRYVPPDIVDEVSKHPELIDLDGELKPLSIIFCDLKDFTGISEQLNPKQLVTMLNSYFITLSAILYQYGATIDKYIGDSVMAFWGAPIAHKDHAQRSVMAALDMHKALAALKQELMSKGLPATDMGVGINSGLVNVGNMGSIYRLNYTVIGDAVNLASRFERLTRVYQVPTIVGEETMQGAPDIVFRELDTVVVKGRSNNGRIYQPICRKDELTESQASNLETHAKAIASYYEKDFEKAEILFKQLASESEAQAYYRYMSEKVSFSKNI
jgi:adenylate cyclase